MKCIDTSESEGDKAIERLEKKKVSLCFELNDDDDDVCCI